MPSYMKYIGSFYPDLAYLSRTVHGIMECHPNVPLDRIINYVNSWPGICGKLTNSVIFEIKQSAQSSFIKSATQKSGNSSILKSSDDLQHSLLKKEFIKSNQQTSALPTPISSSFKKSSYNVLHPGHSDSA